MAYQADYGFQGVASVTALARKRVKRESPRVAPTDQPSENEDRLRFVANAVPALLAYLDIGARYMWANETYRRWFGIAPEEIRGRHISEVLGAAAWEQLRPYIERALQGEEVTFETRIEYKNGPARDIRASYSPHLDSRGKVRGFVVLSNDISEIRTAERALRRSEHMLERSQSTAHVGSWEVTVGGPGRHAGGPVRWSDEMFRMLGYEPGSFSVTYPTFFEFMHPEDSRTGARRRPEQIQRGEVVETNFGSSGPMGRCGSSTPGPTLNATPPARRSA